MWLWLIMMQKLESRTVSLKPIIIGLVDRVYVSNISGLTPIDFLHHNQFLDVIEWLWHRTLQLWIEMARADFLLPGSLMTRNFFPSSGNRPGNSSQK